MSPCGKQELDFFLTMDAFISLAAGCLPVYWLLWIWDLLKGKRCIRGDDSPVKDVCAVSRLHLASTPPPHPPASALLVVWAAVHSLEAGTLQCEEHSMTHLSAFHFSRDILLVHPRGALAIHLPKNKQCPSTNSCLPFMSMNRFKSTGCAAAAPVFVRGWNKQHSSH